MFALKDSPLFAEFLKLIAFNNPVSIVYILAGFSIRAFFERLCIGTW
jgi:hypothetical protein